MNKKVSVGLVKTLKSFLLIMFFSCSANVWSQVGIGTVLPSKSTQLQVVATDKGITIPNVRLTGEHDLTTITEGNIESLLVYNVSEVGGMSHGYYYWSKGSWHRLLSDKNIGNQIRTGVGIPGAHIVDMDIGDFYVNEQTGELYVYTLNGWVAVGSSKVKVDNGIAYYKGFIGLGGQLIEPTTITTDASNTLAIQGLQTTTNNTADNNVVVADKNSGVLRMIDPGGFIQQDQTVVVATESQQRFTTPLVIKNADKINVYRNGARVEFTIIDNDTIELEPEAKCYQGDEVRIVQLN